MIIFDDYKCSDIRERESVQYLNINLKMRRVTLDCFYSLLGKNVCVFEKAYSPFKALLY